LGLVEAWRTVATVRQRFRIPGTSAAFGRHFIFIVVGARYVIERVRGYADRNRPASATMLSRSRLFRQLRRFSGGQCAGPNGLASAPALNREEVHTAAILIDSREGTLALRLAKHEWREAADQQNDD